MTFDIKSQRISWQLSHLYELLPTNPLSDDYSHFRYDLLHDFLIEQGHNFDIPADDKKILWKLSKIKFNREYTSIVNRYKKLVKSELIRYNKHADAMPQKELFTTAEIDQVANNRQIWENELKRLYKGFLARYYITVKYQEGYTLSVRDSTDNPIKKLSFIEKE
jgi:hypothetical protein